MRIRMTQEIETSFKEDALRWAVMWTTRYESDEPYIIDKNAHVEALFKTEDLAKDFQKSNFPKGGIVVRILDTFTEVQALEETIGALTKALDESSEAIEDASKTLETTIEKRDTDWCLAFADAIGLNSDAPIAPGGVKGCIEQLLKRVVVSKTA